MTPIPRETLSLESRKEMVVNDKQSKKARLYTNMTIGYNIGMSFAVISVFII